MMSILTEINETLQKGRSKVVCELVQKALEEKIPATEIVQSLLDGMDVRYLKGNDIVPGLGFCQGGVKGSLCIRLQLIVIQMGFGKIRGNGAVGLAFCGMAHAQMIHSFPLCQNGKRLQKHHQKQANGKKADFEKTFHTGHSFFVYVYEFSILLSMRFVKGEKGVAFLQFVQNLSPKIYCKTKRNVVY